eukprot:9527321-Alexandrium_andersonii.AAC.1
MGESATLGSAQYLQCLGRSRKAEAPNFLQRAAIAAQKALMQVAMTDQLARELCTAATRDGAPDVEACIRAPQ